MNGNYNLRSRGQDLEARYGKLPWTACSRPHRISTSGKDQAQTRLDAIGCHPSRWVYELLNNDFLSCDLVDRARAGQLPAPFDTSHAHRLVNSGKQSHRWATRTITSTLCLDCHFHFIIRTSWHQAHVSTLCSKAHAEWVPFEDRPCFHHLAYAGTEPGDVIDAERQDGSNVVSREMFACTAAQCTYTVTVDVCEPRLSTEMLELLQDEDTILKALNTARENEPDRYQVATDEWAKQAPLNLNTYLRNMLEDPPEKQKTISKRNKRFAVVFGPRCFDLFRYLGFAEEITLTENGVDEGSFISEYPPRPADAWGPTEIGSRRAFIEDARSEVQALIHKKGVTFDEAQKPQFVNALIHELLGVEEILNLGDNELVQSHSHQLIGVVPGLHKIAIVNAYFQQWNLIPSRRQELIVALALVAQNHPDETLAEYAATQDSVYGAVASPGSPLGKALALLGLAPPNTYDYGEIMAAYRQKLFEDPASISDLREALMALATDCQKEDMQLRLVVEGGGESMTADTAMAVLGCPDAVTPIQWLGAAEHRLEKAEDPRAKPALLQAIQTLVSDNDDPLIRDRWLRMNSIHASGTSSNVPIWEQPGDVALPVGLSNIGNTCYLNSLLQYLFTVKPVRDIVTNYEAYQLEMDDKTLEERRLGANKMKLDRAEAVVSQVFVKELGALFESLVTSDKKAQKPTQRLANAVLLDTNDLLQGAHSEAEARAPPLPARPSPASPSRDVPTGTADGQEAASNASTAVDDESSPEVTHAEDASEDVIMEDVEPSIEEKVQKALEVQKRSSGTEQQDAEEVIGRIINRLQAAIRPTGVDEATGIQLEKIIETFFLTTVNYTKKFDDTAYQTEISYDRSITAFPAADGSCSLEEALGRNFDLQVLEDSRLLRYTAIRQLPPVLHVLIQRTQSNGTKNMHPVVIPEELSLDKFMDAQHDSEEFTRRSKGWALSQRLQDVNRTLNQTVKSNEGSAALLSAAVASVGSTEDAEMVDESEEDWTFDGPVDEDFMIVNPEDAVGKGPPAPPEDLAAAENELNGMIQAEGQELVAELDSLYAGASENVYRLEAVICHRGQAASGHYWVWIYDFEDGLWRHYNDEAVEVKESTEQVLSELNTKGEPYYLCYVRDSDKEKWVEVPKRTMVREI
ncbi:ubiquitin carboxyl-terminal hydrolase [Emericellopsis cladophorae]|uniref:ubiquitinyl hydrolase 1 n=1 Tax=Emericellopsis cladophorae TaxID=2686198 RepID=A0A9P9Y0N7_9HYPO|nr:ubiquitin carboxyl-terminal hydrolase [Emericellopsis cladophorae]KAI6780794.1 ubiquitin carboxyl-terminal hydrolase [Emericellopsis cladophorae]